jgi:hypothetical protein
VLWKPILQKDTPKIPKGLEENKDIARKGGNAAKKARLEIEKQTGKPIVTTKNANNLLDKPNHKNIENEQTASNAITNTKATKYNYQL